ncbi:hypothetical protein G9A89_016949 [Geosiphon pyriformis]|nr:hypothetical protein G9A89_016949 [Geosiphon pyriformis]
MNYNNVHPITSDHMEVISDIRPQLYHEKSTQSIQYPHVKFSTQKRHRSFVTQRMSDVINRRTETYRNPDEFTDSGCIAFLKILFCRVRTHY